MTIASSSTEYNGWPNKITWIIAQQINNSADTRSQAERIVGDNGGIAMLVGEELGAWVRESVMGQCEESAQRDLILTALTYCDFDHIAAVILGELIEEAAITAVDQQMAAWDAHGLYREA